MSRRLPRALAGSCRGAVHEAGQRIGRRRAGIKQRSRRARGRLARIMILVYFPISSGFVTRISIRVPASDSPG